MKLKNIIKLTTLSASVGLFVSCKDAATSDTPAAESTDAKASTEQSSVPLTPLTPATKTSQAESLPVYIVTVSGAGWGVGDKTSSVLTAQSGVNRVKLSGLRATVFIDEGTTLDESAIKSQLEEEGLGLVSLESATISKPVAAYTINLEGTGGWSDTAEKVRVALEKMDHVSTAFVNDNAELYLSTDTELDQSVVKSVIDEAGAKFLDITKEQSISL